ncbi:MAG: DUF2235 domain-containing protein [Acidobacteriota bacterium]|nr:DUF2235 domain-containing protein [Acidobacteriota bacterium]
MTKRIARSLRRTASSENERRYDETAARYPAALAETRRFKGSQVRNLVLCFDGTWKREDQPHPTNVVKTFQAIRRKAGPTRQVPYYDRGVGTGRLDRLRGGALGTGLLKNVEQAYVWLAQNYRPGDRLFFFGFSRGAYTARRLAGLVGLCGVPNPARWPGLEPEPVVREGLRIYRQTGQAREEKARRFSTRRGHLEAETREPLHQVWFIGVWDTVGSLGVPGGVLFSAHRRHQFHDARLGAHVRYAYHAIAIDENRRHFKPTLWTGPAADGQTVQQLWFPGVHANVGGGVPETGLSDRALLWIWLQAQNAGLFLCRPAIAPDEFGFLRDSMKWPYRLFGRHRRPIGGINVTGEGIHFSAVKRLARTGHYQEWTAGRTLRPVVAARSVRRVPRMPGE